MACSPSPSFASNNFRVNGFLLRSFIHLELVSTRRDLLMYFLSAVNGFEYRAPWLLKMLRPSDNWVLNPEQDIYSTPSKARGIFWRVGGKLKAGRWGEELWNIVFCAWQNECRLWQPVLTLHITSQWFIKKGLRGAKPCLLNYWLSCILGKGMKCAVFS